MSEMDIDMQSPGAENIDVAESLDLSTTQSAPLDDTHSQSRPSHNTAPHDGADFSCGAHDSDLLKTRANATAVRSIEGWIIIVTNVHEEATEETLSDRFSDFGQITNLHLNLDRRSGYVKGYALIEYKSLAEARKAIDAVDNTELLEQIVSVDFAFVKL